MYYTYQEEDVTFNCLSCPNQFELPESICKDKKTRKVYHLKYTYCPKCLLRQEKEIRKNLDSECKELIDELFEYANNSI